MSLWNPGLCPISKWQENNTGWEQLAQLVERLLGKREDPTRVFSPTYSIPVWQYVPNVIPMVGKWEQVDSWDILAFPSTL